MDAEADLQKYVGRLWNMRPRYWAELESRSIAVDAEMQSLAQRLAGQDQAPIEGRVRRVLAGIQELRVSTNEEWRLDSANRLESEVLTFTRDHLIGGRKVLEDDITQVLAPALGGLGQWKQLAGSTHSEVVSTTSRLVLTAIGTVPIVGGAATLLDAVRVIREYLAKETRVSDAIEVLRDVAAYDWLLHVFEREGLANVAALVEKREVETERMRRVVEAFEAGVEQMAEPLRGSKSGQPT